ncbi:hypothetical protein CR152_02520 [Massilia violaceinigra]|uniref:Type IV secretion protein Rhs n=1 Tax=Massilia violaceinigra TaxID=2045208 RepID=A0A2D2DEV1_9BURK|nr:RHS repeat-associated core domain-containing protein [Massilia violaceinigra]ATQ73515.1 hypothetical protein CR152_02520 [Massilia violaceinigra]
MFEAARITDPISHTNALTGFLIGALIGIALIAAVAFATFTCGFGVALIAGLAAGFGASGILSLGEAIGKMSTTVTGTLVTGSLNVWTNGLAATYAKVSTAACSMHNPVQLVAEGSGNVYINGLPAARKDDAITCGAKISGGSSNVFIGGGREPYLPVADEIPPGLRTAVDWAFTAAGAVGGIGKLLCKAGGGLTRAVLPCAARFLAGFAAGEALSRYVIAPVVGRAIGGLLGEPVDVTTGRKLLLAQEETDFVLPGQIPLTGARFYGSNLERVGDLGRGWVLPWEVWLQARDGKVWYSDGQGRETGFPMMQPGHAEFSESEQCFLTRSADGRFIMYDVNDVYYDFGQLDVTGGELAPLLRIEDRSGQWQHYARDAAQRLLSIETSDGQMVRLAYGAQSGRLEGIERVRGGAPAWLVRYGYDSLGQLISVHDANGNLARQFSYADGLMTSHTSALGFVSQYRWEIIDGAPRVVECGNSEGERTRFAYDPAGRQTRATDELGRSAHWIYDAHFQVVQCTDLDGGVYRISYTDAGSPATLDLPGERKVVFEYDAMGRLVGETDPLGRRTTTGYDGHSMRVTQLAFADGQRWQAEYDFSGRLLRTTDVLGREERYEYDETGVSPLPIVHVDARGGRQQMRWDERGQLLAYTDCSGKTTHYTYDNNGELESFTDALGQVTRYENLPTGEPARILLADGSVEEYVYDAEGLVTFARRNATQTRHWKRNARGQVIEAVDPAGHISHYRYDVRGRPVELATAPDTRYLFSYDAGDRLEREVRPDGVERHRHYDPAGEIIALDEHGAPTPGQAGRALRTTLFTRDKMGRLLVKQTATAISRYEWSAGDLLTGTARMPTEAGAALGVTESALRFGYDAAGRLIAEEGAEGRVDYELDELDNITGLRLPHDHRIDTLSYGSGHVHQIRMGERVISDFERDDLHREVAHTQGALMQKLGYDKLGRRLWQASARKTEAHGAGLGLLWRNYRYDPIGELGEQRDNIRGAIQYQYDLAGRMLKQNRVAQQRLETFAWDAAGNLLDDVARKSGGRIEGNRLKAWQDLRFDYDPWGNLLTKRKGANQVQHFSFDADDRLIKVSTQDAWGTAETLFDYDPLGRRIAKTELRGTKGAIPAEGRRRFVWQGLRMVQEIRDGALSCYIYSPDEGFTPLARVDTAIGQGVALAAAGSEQPRSRIYHFHTDLVGAPLEVTDESGEMAWTASYTAWGKADIGDETAMASRIEQPLRYPGQYADQSTGLHYNTFRFYDPDIGRYISPDPIGLEGGTNLFAYVPNPTGWADPLGWDWNYHLTDSSGKVYYHGRASDKQTMADVARRHGNNKGKDGFRFGKGDTMTRITAPGTPKLTAQGIEGIAIDKTGVIGRRKKNGNRVRGNAIAGVDPKKKSAPAKIKAGKAFLNGRVPSQMGQVSGTPLKGTKC